MEDSLEITRRRLPHWCLRRSAYFITWRVAIGKPPLAELEREITASALKYFQNDRYRLYCYVVMNDHIHCIIEPLQGWLLSKLLHSWKSFTAHRMVKECSRQPPVWQDESYDRIIRNEVELMEKALYIVTNPKRRWPGTEEYKWVEWFSFD